MPRQARNVISGAPYHVVQKGNRDQDVFFTNSHRVNYINNLALYSKRYGFNVLAYCLMSNHIHIVGIPTRNLSMSRTLQITQMRHSQSVNREMGWRGHLWHSRYYASILDDPHMWTAIKYVEQNPLRAGLVKTAEDFPWSSAACHCSIRDDELVYQDEKLDGMFDNWSDELREFPDTSELDRLRKCTLKGNPCGSAEFARQITRKTSRLARDRDREKRRNPHK